MRASTLSGFSGFENPTTSDFIAPNATYHDRTETSSQNSFPNNVEPEYRSPGYREIQGSHTHKSDAFTHTPRFSFIPPLDYETRGPTPGPSKVTTLDPASRPASVTPRSSPARTDASNTDDPLTPEGEAPTFADPEIPPIIKHAMRKLAHKIQSSEFVRTNREEPILGSHDADNLMAVVSSDVWNGYGTKGRSVYSVFIKEDGKNCKCLWCGKVQKDKMQRAIGHFRKKHMDHKPFPCRLMHTGGKPWYVCPFFFLAGDVPYASGPVLDSPRRFPTLEAMTDHQKKKETLEMNGKRKCLWWYVQHNVLSTSADGAAFSGHEYASISNLNRHQNKCTALPRGGKDDT